MYIDDELKQYGFTEHTCEDGLSAMKRDEFIWMNEGQFRFKFAGECAVLINDTVFKLDTIEKILALYTAITGRKADTNKPK
jgi:hypothetical protein